MTTTYTFRRAPYKDLKEGDRVRLPRLIVDGEVTDWAWRIYDVSEVEWISDSTLMLRMPGPAKPNCDPFILCAGSKVPAGVNRVTGELHYCRDGADIHRVTYTPCDESHSVAELSWSEKRRGEVLFISVHPHYRRQGIATAMWRMATTWAETKPRHSRDRTPDGRAWIASLRKAA